MNNVHPLFQGIINSHFPTNVEEAEIVEEEEEEDMEDKASWRKKDIQENLRTMDRNSSHFVIWLSWLRENKNFDAEKIINVVENYYEYVDEFQEFLEDWYKIKDEAPF